MSGLELTLLLLLAAVVGVVLFRMLHLPPLLAYLAVGALIGPHALKLAPNAPDARYIAEFGVVFLMFSIGLEFSLTQLKAMRKVVFGLGLAQVVLTIAITMLGAVLLQWWFPISYAAAFVLGGTLAMSSTAIVVKLLIERLELDSAHGRQIMGTLLFQDLAVVPLLILIPALSFPPQTMLMQVGIGVAKAAVVLLVLLVIGQPLMRMWFDIVARRKSQELFVLNVLLIVLGLAWVTEHTGLSLALGAFVAGVLISETPYRHQVEEDIKPFREVLLGLFFISTGMLLDPRVVLEQWGLVILFAVVPLLLKFALIAGLARAFGAAPGVAVRTGLGLAQAGEFGFVLLNQAGIYKIIPASLEQPVLAAMLISMLVAPFLIRYSDRIALRLTKSDWMMQSLALTNIAQQSIATKQHVLICGYGRSGQTLARILEQEKLDYVALDLDPDRVREAVAAGERVVYGDCARRESLQAAGLARASAVVISYNDTPSALRVLALVQELAPKVPVIVRTTDDTDLEKLRAAGASEVVPEIIEGSLMLGAHALLMVGLPIRKVLERVRQVRDARYGALRGYFHGADDVDDDEDHVRLHAVPISAEAACVGQALAQLNLQQYEVQVAAVRRRQSRSVDPAPDMQVLAGDTLVLRGTSKALAIAEEFLLTSAD